jgi:uncharacterized membrane protein
LGFGFAPVRGDLHPQDTHTLALLVAGLLIAGSKAMEFPKKTLFPDSERALPIVEHRTSDRPVARWIWGVAIGLVILGGLLRWVNLDVKPFWIDEAFTSFHVSGFSDQIVTQRLVQDRPFPNESLQLFQTVNAERGAIDMVQHIAATAPELPPLYFLTLRAWVSLLGDSIAATRSLSVVLSLLLFPVFYGLAQELFDRRAASLAALTVLATSPYQLIYAQEARPYTLWALLIVGSHWLLLRALRLRGWPHWLAYGLCLTAGLYVHFLSLLLLAAQGLYVWHRSHWRLMNAAVRSWLLIAVSAGLCYVPWVVFALSNLTNNPAVHSTPISRGAWLVLVLKAALRSSTIIFADFNMGDMSGDGSTRLRVLAFGVSLGLLGSMFLALGRFWPRLQTNQKLFLGWNILFPVLVFLSADVLFPSPNPYINSPRYMFAGVLMLQLLVGAWIAHVVQRGTVWSRSLVAGVLAVGVMSSGVFIASDHWWNKDSDNANRTIAAVVNHVENPVLVTDNFFIYPFALSHVLNPGIPWVLSPKGTVPTIPSGFKTVYAFDCTPPVLDKLKEQYDLIPAAKRLLELRSLSPRP